jgi:hypothetical protein
MYGPDSVTFQRVRELLSASPGMISMEEEGEAPTVLRVELATIGDAELFALKFQLHPQLHGFVPTQRGSIVIVGERD